MIHIDSLNWQYVAAPVIGALIGLITNGIAIKMLFRPLKPMKIGNWTVPFTPGLIPKEKPRIAKAIGQTIGQYLLDVDTLTHALASDNLKKALDKKVDTVIETMGHEEETVAQYLAEKGLLDTTVRITDKAGNSISEYIASYLVEQDIGATVLEYAMSEVMSNLNSMMAMMAAPALERAKPSIARKIDETILQECPNIVKGYINDGYQSWLDKPMKEVGIFLWQKKDLIKDKIWELYMQILNDKAGRFIQRLDVSAIVEDKINEFDNAYLEKLIMDIARKELNSLVWIGGLLGMVIGFANLLF